MPTPLLIDTDMGIDDAVAVTLALCSPELQVAGIVSVGGNVCVDQATRNIGRILGALRPAQLPAIARGLDQGDELQRAEHVFGSDGLGQTKLPETDGPECGEYLELYERLLTAHAGELVIVAVGPLTNLGALLKERPELLRSAARIVIMGGAIWCPGNVTPHAEFNFYRDPAAAAAILASGLPVTLVPLDVTRQVGMDESHMAQLSRSNTRTGEIVADMIRFPLERGGEGDGGKFLVHDALAVGVLLWPELFIQARMAVDVVTSGKQAGRSKPAVAKDKTRQIGAVISTTVDDFLEKLIERTCNERFVV